MRLRKLKLAGFKSFVDPTQVPLPSNLTAVVGPNGCGKSNIIDAVRWVLGESSAKNLRGESMTDVIFNGSSARKPVGQAFVELVFDNNEGMLGGEYAAYSEIAIKRLVNREGQSTYYLNGARCRRKDITNIFLGTGLGPRSYSIIEQGTISRLIEAKPEEFRVFLEEAAGISKYKERRRETENRMRSTRENLERVNDIREELGKQLARLERQAKAAERYQTLKVDEQRVKSQWLLLKWQALQIQLQQEEQKITQSEIECERLIAQMRDFERSLTERRQLHDETQEQFSAVQAEYYALGNEIARLEEAIAHQREKRARLQQELQQVNAEIAQGESARADDFSKLETLTNTLNTQTPRLGQMKERLAQEQERVLVCEEQFLEWQEGWDDFNTRAHESSKQAHVEQARIQQLETAVQQLNDQITKLQEERLKLDPQPIKMDLQKISEKELELNEQQERYEHGLEALNEQIQQYRKTLADHEHSLAETREQLQVQLGRQSSLQALQQAALGQTDTVANAWLEKQGLGSAGRLGQDLQVDTGWEKAVETVLSDVLQAVCVDDVSAYVERFVDMKQGSLSLYNPQAQAASASANGAARLLDKIQTQANLSAFCGNIYTADTLADALAFIKRCAPHESIITRDGLWLSPTFARLRQDEDVNAGVLVRERELNDIAETIATLEAQIEEVESLVEAGKASLLDVEKEREEVQQALAKVIAEYAECQGAQQVKENQLQQIYTRGDVLKEEIAAALEQQQDKQAALTQAQDVWQKAMQAMDNEADERQELLARKQHLETALANQRQTYQELQYETVDLELTHKEAVTQKSALEQALARLQAQVKELLARRDGIEIAMQTADSPEADLQTQLQAKLSLHKEKEDAVSTVRNQLDALNEETRQLDKQRADSDQAARAVEAGMQQCRIDAQTYRVKQSGLEEQLEEIGSTLQDVAANLPEEANEPEWEEELQRIYDRIKRLGAINLAAIDEFKVESERKVYLDSQFDDLTKALETLEEAINKIDKETKARFKETYDAVNSKFQELFPKLFGGGKALLELTGDNLLDTGVTVIAQPPGKRNSSIHLLSGGEKALTAVALVFAIFHLNPSPFCMLDEVDAPLDDANVNRFCQLVKGMSDKVQFIFITHNKVTMELADYLAGVTMQEPGVSRMVSVDVDEAIELAEA
jgi:chromosome segregation protein